MGFLDKLKGGIEVEEKEEPKKKKKKVKKIKVEKAELKPEDKLELKEEPQTEGELAIDVYETNGDIIVRSTIGGIKAEDLDISVEGDMVSIRGTRENKIEREGKKYFYQECYWGAFARRVILPEKVDGSKARASMKDGVLTLTIPKLHQEKKRKIAVKQEE